MRELYLAYLAQHDDAAWLRVVDRDRVAGHFVGGLARSITGADAALVTIEDVLDLIWARAPEPIALVLDDVHLLGDGGESVAILTAVLNDLPRNGHLVLSCRTLPPIPLGRMQSEGAALVLREADLAFSDDELGAGLAGLRAEGFVEAGRLGLTPQGAAFANDLCKRRLAPLRRVALPRPSSAAA